MKPAAACHNLAGGNAFGHSEGPNRAWEERRLILPYHQQARLSDHVADCRLFRP
jgi:hypothetical protein